MNKKRPFLLKPLPGETNEQFKSRVKRVLKIPAKRKSSKDR